MMNVEHPQTLRDASFPQERVAAISVLTVDDHPVFREGIAAVLNLEPDVRVAAEAASVSEALALYREHRPYVVLMDIQLPDGSGIDATAQICREFPGAKVIILTTYQGDVRTLNALRAGALGFLLKNTLRRELVDCVRLVHRGEQHIFTEVALELTMHAVDDALTTREIHVLGIVARGESNKGVGRALGIAEETVKTHMASVLTKLRANDRTHAVLIGIRRGIIEQG
jgi:DNA-binding NarL/FixJ family response regulator